MNKITVKEANNIVGGLTSTSKMPCDSFSTSPKKCVTGSKLRKIKGSICETCFACKGFYKVYEKTIKPAQDRRYRAINNPKWTEAMTVLVSRQDGFFRWFDSGDIKSVKHLRKIIKVAENTPSIKHWLPTKERGFVRDFLNNGGKIPNNLVIRYSAFMIDEKPPSFKNTSTVHTKGNFKYGIACKAKNGSCGDCRLCWDENIKNISYEKH